MHRLFFYLLLFLPIQLGYHFWPDWSMVLGRQVDYLSPTLFLTDILIVSTLIFWLRKVSVVPTILFVLVALVNIFFSVEKFVAVYHWIRFGEFVLLGYYIVKTKPSLSVISNLLSVSILYSSLIAIVQFALQHSIGGPLWFLGERTFGVDSPGIARIVLGGKEFLRAYGTFPHPNVLGGFLVTAMLFISTHMSNRKRYLYIFTMLLGIVALALTFSRSAWIVFGLGICWIMYRNRRIAFFMLIACILAFVALSFHPKDESVFVRQELNASAISIFKSYPLSGVGLGNFLVVLPDHLPSRTIYFLQPVHNMYLLLLSEVGLVGVIGAIWLIRGKIKLSLSLAALLLLGLVDHYPATLQQGRLLLTLFIALAYRAPR